MLTWAKGEEGVKNPPKSADIVYGRPLSDFQAARGGASGTQGVAVFLLFLHHLLLLARD